MADDNPKRRRYLINPSFQIRWSLIIALVGGVTATIFSTMLWSSLAEHSELLRSATVADRQLHEATLDISILLLNMPETTAEDAKELKAKIAESNQSFEASRGAYEERMQSNLLARYALIGFVIVITVCLFAWGVILTHRVAGPLYVIKRGLDNYRAGGAVAFRPLRKKDEFQEVYDSLGLALGTRQPGPEE